MFLVLHSSMQTLTDFLEFLIFQCVVSWADTPYNESITGAWTAEIHPSSHPPKMQLLF